MGNRERRTLKKLIAAARHWVGADKPARAPLAVDANVAEGLRAFGVGAADIEAVQERDEVGREDADCEVFADNWESVQFFLLVQTQWVFASAGMGGSRRVGLNYPGVESGARMAGVRRGLWPGLLADLQVMEQAVLAADAEVALEADGS